MERKELLAALEVVAPALSSGSVIPILSHLCFSGKSVLAYNDHVAISLPLKTSFSGAAPGSTLLGLLRMSRAKSVSFDVDEKKNEVGIKLSSANIRLALLPVTDFVFKMPAWSDKEASVVVSDKIIQAVTYCLKSVGSDTTHPEMLGITIRQNKEDAAIYATNGATMTRAIAPGKLLSKTGDRVILSEAFSKQFIALADKKAELQITSEHALMRFGAGGLLFGQNLHDDRPLEYENIIAEHYSDGTKKNLVTGPFEKLHLALERAVVIAEGPSSDAFARIREITQSGIGTTDIDVQDGVVLLESKSARGEVKDSIPFEQKGKASIKVAPRELRDCLTDYDRLLFTNNAIILTKGQIVHLISAHR